MQRATAGLLPRFLWRTPLALVRPLSLAPLLAAMAPPPLLLAAGLLRGQREVRLSQPLHTSAIPPHLLPSSPILQLHVFAKVSKHDDFAKVLVADGLDAGDLKKAIVAELKLDAAPNRARLLLEVEGGAPVLLDSCKKLAAQGVEDGSKVVVEVLAPDVPPSPAPVVLKFREAVKGAPDQEFEQPFASAAQFDRFLASCTVSHMRPAADGKKVRRGGLDRIIQHVYSLDDAVLCGAATPGDYLRCENRAAQMQDDVSNLKSFRANLSSGFELLANRAISCNKDLQRLYGTLVPLNNGRCVQFFDVDGAFVECDGLIKNSKVVLLNEAKTSFHEKDVAKLKRSTAVKLGLILASPSDYTSKPDDVIEELEGLALVLVASGAGFTKEAEAACAEAGIHQLRHDGSGFECILATAPLTSAVSMTSAAA